MNSFISKETSSKELINDIDNISVDTAKKTTSPSESQSIFMPAKLNFDENKICEPESKTSEAKVCCNCKKSKCLKLYCECFSAGLLCQGCDCRNCGNIETNSLERIKAISLTVKTKQSQGCNCKKTGCLKKYCECYQSGGKCSDLCKCQNCKNSNSVGVILEREQQINNSHIFHSNSDSKYFPNEESHNSCDFSQNIRDFEIVQNDYAESNIGKHRHAANNSEIDDEINGISGSMSQKKPKISINAFNSFQSSNLLGDLINSRKSSNFKNYHDKSTNIKDKSMKNLIKSEERRVDYTIYESKMNVKKMNFTSGSSDPDPRYFDDSNEKSKSGKRLLKSFNSFADDSINKY